MLRVAPRAHPSREPAPASRAALDDASCLAVIRRQLAELAEVVDAQSPGVDVPDDGRDQGAFGERYASLAIKSTQLACSKPGITAKGAMLPCDLTFATTCQIASPSQLPKPGCCMRTHES